MMGDACEEPVIHGLGSGEGTRGGWVAPAGSAFSESSSSSLFSSTSSLTDDGEGDDATSSPPGSRPVHSSSSSLTSSELSEKVNADGDAEGGALYGLPTMLDHLPALRTGLSKFYRGRSQSFASLAGVSCVEDLAKKATPYIRRVKASRCHAEALGAKNRLSKKIAKKALSSSAERLTLRARSASLLRSGARPPAYYGNREVYRC